MKGQGRHDQVQAGLWKWQALFIHLLCVQTAGPAERHHAAGYIPGFDRPDLVAGLKQFGELAIMCAEIKGAIKGMRRIRQPVRDIARHARFQEVIFFETGCGPAAITGHPFAVEQAGRRRIRGDRGRHEQRYGPPGPHGKGANARRG